MLLNNYLTFQEALKRIDFGNTHSKSGYVREDFTINLNNTFKDYLGDTYDYVVYNTDYNCISCALSTALKKCNRLINADSALANNSHKLTDNFNTSNTSTLQIIIGTGNLSTSLSDYKLNNKISASSYKWESSTINSVDDEENRVKKITLNQGFLALSDLNISEIGLVGNLLFSITDKYAWKAVLFTRDVLDEPLIVPANTHFELSIEICEPY